MRFGQRDRIGFVAFLRVLWSRHCRVAAMAVSAAQHDRFRSVHAISVGLGVAGHATDAFCLGLIRRLSGGRGRCADKGVITRHRLLSVGGEETGRHHERDDEEEAGKQ